MPKLVKKSQLRDLLLDLWNKIQDKLNGYVHKAKDNVVAGKTVLLDGYITGVSVFNVNNPRANGTMGSDTCVFVCENMRVSANQKVCQVTIGVNSNKQIGDKITGVNIGAIKASNGQVLDYVMQNGVAYVHKNVDSQLGCDKAITINIDKTWTEDVHLMVGANGALWGERNSNYGGNAFGGTSLPSVGGTVNLYPNGNYVGKAIAYGNDVSLRDLGSSSTNAVTRDEFNTLKGDNSREHQTLQSNINTVSSNVASVSSRVDSTNQNVSSQGQRISTLENNTAKLRSENIFTSKNVFENRSPIVTKYFSIKNVVKTGNLVATNNSHYYCNQKEELNPRTHVSGILVPLHNSRPGDQVRAEYFVLDSYANRVLEMPGERTYTVQDIQYQGHYCIVFDVNKSFTHHASFGFSVKDTVFPGRRVSLLKQVNNTGGWYSAGRPYVNQVLNNNDTFLIPYVIAVHASSEVVTRYDLANNTIPLEVAQVGELKFLAFDKGESYELNGHTWVKCEGQTVASSEYGELCMATQCVSEDEVVEFKLPSNNSPVGYTYICAK